MNLFQNIGKALDETIISITAAFESSTKKEKKYKKRTRISDKELHDIIVNDFKSSKSEQLLALHKLGFGASNVRIGKAWNKVKKEALAQQIKENMTKV